MIVIQYRQNNEQSKSRQSVSLLEKIAFAQSFNRGDRIYISQHRHNVQHVQFGVCNDLTKYNDIESMCNVYLQLLFV